MRKMLVFLALMCFSISLFAQKVEWACRVIETNDPNTESYAPKQLLHLPDAYPSANKAEGSSSGYTYCMGYTYEKAKPKKFPDITFKLEYCNPIAAEQVVIVETYGPGTITKVEVEDTKGRTKLIYKEKAAKSAEPMRLLYIPIEKFSTPIRYVTITAAPGEVEGVNCIDAVGLCPTKAPVSLKINLGADLHFVAKSKPLGMSINSGYEDILPIIAPSGKVLYFDRKDHPQNVRNPENLQEIRDDIYFSKKNEKGEWTEAMNIGKPLNNYGHNFVNSISPDGNTMLIANTYNTDGSPKGGGASVSKRIKGQGWSMPEALFIKEYKNKNKYVSYFMANTNTVLLMSVEDESTLGEKDICVSFIQSDGSWSKPMNIGNDINTIQDEYSPVLASDNKTLYFASKGHLGYGSYDIFVTKRLDESWAKWSTPINLGSEINNSSSTMGFSIAASGKEVYTYGWVGDSKKDDIFMTELGEAKSIQPDPVYLVYGTVYDAKTKQPIHADILYENLTSGAKVGTAGADPDNGEYKIVLPAGQHYSFFAIAKGYIAVHENLDVAGASGYMEIQRNLYLVPLQAGQKIALNNVFFEQSKSVMLPASYPELDRMAAILVENPKVEIRIDGHTDNQGDAKKNMELSQQRVDVVKNYLSSKGISAKRISTKAYGGTRPIASNTKEETRKLNRRVEFTIVKN
jgi:outer membrane protein OmpA-like peptidoglycan-associated protein